MEDPVEIGGSPLSDLNIEGAYKGAHFLITIKEHFLLFIYLFTCRLYYYIMQT